MVLGAATSQISLTRTATYTDIQPMAIARTMRKMQDILAEERFPQCLEQSIESSAVTKELKVNSLRTTLIGGVMVLEICYSFAKISLTLLRNGQEDELEGSVRGSIPLHLQ